MLSCFETQWLCFAYKCQYQMMSCILQEIVYKIKTPETPEKETISIHQFGIVFQYLIYDAWFHFLQVMFYSYIGPKVECLLCLCSSTYDIPKFTYTYMYMRVQFNFWLLGGNKNMFENQF